MGSLLILMGVSTLPDTEVNAETNAVEFFSKFFVVSRRIEQTEVWKKWGLSSGYSDHFPTAITITPQNQLCLERALNCTYFMRHWFRPTGRHEHRFPLGSEPILSVLVSGSVSMSDSVIVIL